MQHRMFNSLIKKKEEKGQWVETFHCTRWEKNGCKQGGCTFQDKCVCSPVFLPVLGARIMLLHLPQWDSDLQLFFLCVKKRQVMENTNHMKSYRDILLWSDVQKSFVNPGLILGVKTQCCIKFVMSGNAAHIKVTLHHEGADWTSGK